VVKICVKKSAYAAARTIGSKPFLLMFSTFALLDNFAFYGQQDGLSLRLSTPHKKSKHHVEGKLASQHHLHPRMKEIAVVLSCCGSHLKYFLSPFPRYLLNCCCDVPGHVSNLGDEDYFSTLLDSCRDTASQAGCRVGPPL
jgi:hypothetical protein